MGAERVEVTVEEVAEQEDVSEEDNKAGGDEGEYGDCEGWRRKNAGLQGG